MSKSRRLTGRHRRLGCQLPQTAPPCIHHCSVVLLCRTTTNFVIASYMTTSLVIVYSSICLFICAHLSFDDVSVCASKCVLPFRLTGQSWSTSSSCKPRYTQLHERRGRFWNKFSHSNTQVISWCLLTSSLHSELQDIVRWCRRLWG